MLVQLAGIANHPWKDVLLGIVVRFIRMGAWGPARKPQHPHVVLRTSVILKMFGGRIDAAACVEVLLQSIDPTWVVPIAIDIGSIIVIAWSRFAPDKV